VQLAKAREQAAPFRRKRAEWAAQIERLWELPKIGGYQDRFAKAAQEIGHLLRDKT